MTEMQKDESDKILTVLGVRVSAEDKLLLAVAEGWVKTSLDKLDAAAKNLISASSFFLAGYSFLLGGGFFSSVTVAQPGPGWFEGAQN